MNLAILRVQGDEETLHPLPAALDLVLDTTWEKGDPQRRGETSSCVGFSATLIDAPNPTELLKAMRAFIAKCKARRVTLSGPTISTELSIGITVGDSAQFTACLDFSAANLMDLATLGVNLSIAAYPTSDEANEAPTQA